MLDRIVEFIIPASIRIFSTVNIMQCFLCKITSNSQTDVQSTGCSSYSPMYETLRISFARFFHAQNHSVFLDSRNVENGNMMWFYMYIWVPSAFVVQNSTRNVQVGLINLFRGTSFTDLWLGRPGSSPVIVRVMYWGWVLTAVDQVGFQLGPFAAWHPPSLSSCHYVKKNINRAFFLSRC